MICFEELSAPKKTQYLKGYTYSLNAQSLDSIFPAARQFQLSRNYEVNTKVLPYTP